VGFLVNWSGIDRGISYFLQACHPLGSCCRLTAQMEFLKYLSGVAGTVAGPRKYSGKLIFRSHLTIWFSAPFSIINVSPKCDEAAQVV